jgi:galactose mutarotase-like enzyme
MMFFLLLALAAPVFSADVRLITLKDREGSIEVSVAPAKGAEVCSIKVKHHGQWIETLYRACDYSPVQGWTGKAPWLWPATGRNFPSDMKPNEEARGSSYDYKGQRYPMPIHGFVKDMAWKVESVTANRAVLSLESSPATMKMYPFGFRLELDVAARAGELRAEMRVIAASTNTEPMFFSAGNHITFLAPLLKGADPLAMRFSSPSSVEYMKKTGGIPTGEKQPLSLKESTALGEFDTRQARSLGGYGSNEAFMVYSDPSGLALRISHTASSVPSEPVLRFNVWGDPRQGYFSPEPWVGIQNSLNSRNGVVHLAAGETWSWQLRIGPQR